MMAEAGDSNGKTVPDMNGNKAIDTISGSVGFDPVNGTGSSRQLTSQPESRQDSLTCQKVMDMDTVGAICYFIAIIGFLLTFNIEAMPRLPYPLIGNLQDVDPTLMPQSWEQGVVLILAFWGAVYFRKILLMTSEHGLRHMIQRRCPDRERNPLPFHKSIPYIAPLVVYHGIAGLWIGWACNFHIGYFASDSEFLVTGIVIFLAGEIIAYAICFMRITGSGSYSMTSLKVVHEVGEVVSLLGLALYSLTLPACILALVRTVLAVCSVLNLIDTSAF